MTITTGNSPEPQKEIHITAGVYPVGEHFEGEKDVFFDPELDAAYNPDTGAEEQASEWSEKYPDVLAAAQTSGPEAERRFVKFDGDWLSLVTDHVRDSEAETITRLVTDIDGEDEVIASSTATSVEPRQEQGYAFPGEGAAEKIARILAKYSDDDPEKLEGAFRGVAASLQGPDDNIEQRHRLEAEEAEQESAQAAA
ncbi:MAG: hypothetical protein AAB436_03840 [Patescibacteria group bacterium]